MDGISYRNVLHLGVLIQSQLKADRPDYWLEVTSNPGEESEHYIGLVQRIYKMKSLTLKDGTPVKVIDKFVGYITYRFNEVRRSRKITSFPVFSSIEVRDEDFNPLATPIKVHFDKKKVLKEDPAYVAPADADAAQQGLGPRDALQAFWKGRLELAYAAILNYIDNRP